MYLIIYIICFLIFLRYGYVLSKYLKTGEFKKKKYKGNVMGIIAYTSLTVLVISFLILMVLVDKDISSDLIYWILFISGIVTLFAYPNFWIIRTSENNQSKNKEFAKIMNEQFEEKYGSRDKYDKIKLFFFDIPNNVIINNQINKLISILTNEHISFVHPNEYKNLSEVFSYLFQNDYFKIWGGNDSIYITCEKINGLLRKIGINLFIDANEIIKDDDDFIKLRRKDMIPTIEYDLSKINEFIKNNIKDYELVLTQVYDQSNKTLCSPTYLCIGKTSELDEFFNRKKYIIPSSGDFNIYFKKGIKFDNLKEFFNQYNYDVIVEYGDNISIKSKNSNDAIASEFCVSNEEYNEYLFDFENDCKEEDPENKENWAIHLENMKKFDSYYMINSKNEIESKYIIILALYILKENGDALVYDCYNGVYLDSNKLKCFGGDNE